MMEQKTRTTLLRESKYHWGVRSLVFPIFDSDFYSSGSIYSTQVTESEGHQIGRLRSSNEDIGGEFFSSKCEYSDNCPHVKLWAGVPHDSYFFEGKLYPFAFKFDTPVEQAIALDRSDVNLIDALGTTAISRVVPTNPVAGLAVTLGELREGLPKIIGSSFLKKGIRSVPKKVGGEYLNYQFGWAPLISDMKKLINASVKADAIWAQFERDSGKRVRRRYNFPKAIEIVQNDVVSAQPAAAGHLNGLLWQGFNMDFDLYRQIQIERERWFSGAFTYFAEIPKDSKDQWKRDMQRLRKLYGLEITPEVIWNLTPWSWAADWFANTGDIMANMSRFSQDGLVMPYGYMMEKSVKTATYRMRNVTPVGRNIPDLTQVFTHTVKYRRKATPFGFGLNEGTFSPFQWSIIAALGLSRGK